MSGAQLGLAVAVFLACAVEAVEALTIVLAVGSARSWPSALAGTAVALLVLGALVGILGAALTSLAIDDLRVVIGVALLAMGLQWLRKAVLRASGRKALRDERGAYASELAAARTAGKAHADLDGYSFAVAFQGVLLEGLEVALIVVTFGAAHEDTSLAVASAVLAVAVVVAAGLAVRAPLARVPENTMKFVVGVMLSSFGVFWLAEGAGVSWPGGEAILPAIVALLAAGSLLAVASLRRAAPR
jgi:uncharacterized membrane protein